MNTGLLLVITLNTRFSLADTFDIQDIIIVEKRSTLELKTELGISEEEKLDSWLDRLLVPICCCFPCLF